jgi:hypothetical protein
MFVVHVMRKPHAFGLPRLLLLTSITLGEQHLEEAAQEGPKTGVVTVFAVHVEIVVECGEG